MALNDGVAGFTQLDGGALEVKTQSGKTYPADIVILALGVRPDTTLAKAAGLAIGERGGIRVDEQMRTSDPDIFAVGDAIEVKDFVTGEWSLMALAGPANRQGRIAADVIAGRDSRFRGTQGTSIIGLFGGAAAWTGRQREDAEAARRHGLREDLPLPEFARRLLPGREDARDEGPLPQVRRHGSSGRRRSARTGRRWTSGSAPWPWPSRWARRSTTSKKPSCATRRSSAAPRMPVNFAGMVAADVLRGDMPLGHWDVAGRRLPARRARAGRTGRGERAGRGQHPAAASSARASANCPRDREIHVICRSAQRAYYATRILLQNGFKARNISGGMLSRAMLSAE